ncbi:MAG: quinone-interacting membrane-bound oxidoreductase complex subunit QmoC [Desulfobacterales bacterium]
MADRYHIEPDVGFIEEISDLGGGDVKKCFQCATCSVTCPISPDHKPFPRKEMIAASWGLKDKLVKNPDIWLCHNCGDCSTLCPRSARPGDVMAALRAYAIQEYSTPKVIAKAVNDPKKLPLLLGIPAILMVIVGFITGLLDFTPEGDVIAHANFFSTWLVDLFMIPAAIWVMVVFALGLKRFIGDIHAASLEEGKTDRKDIQPVEFIKSLVAVVPKILKHDKFNECTENTDRSTQHMMVLFGFIGLFIVTAIFFVVLYGFGIHGPYSQLNPVKWLANISGVALVIGIGLMLKSRMSNPDQQVSTYKDWFLLWLIFAVAVSGMLAEMTRLAGMAATTYTIYFAHMVTVFALFIYLPFSKLAHLVYRTVAMAYAEYSNRGF